jgi:quinol-cytochrome oxidoreductase complex cytochrome b subunit
LFKFKKVFLFNHVNKFNYWVFIFRFLLLTWLGGQLAEEPFIFVSQILRFLYFFAGIIFL